jgi:hypothetical protein
VLIGERGALAMCVKNNRTIVRNTGLVDALLAAVSHSDGVPGDVSGELRAGRETLTKEQ